MRPWKACALALALTLSAGTARAQSIDLTAPDPVADQLADLRLSLLSERGDAGLGLLVAGLASVVGGAVTAGVGHEDPFVLSFGLGTAGWGAVNAALSLVLLDLGGAGAARIEADRELRHGELLRAREAELRRQHDSATLFALNVGLDVFYVATGALLFLVAEQLNDPAEQAMLRGYSVAQMTQGAFLLTFDLVEWIGSVQGANRVAEVPVPRG
jgi:hypothetical protein